MSWEATHTHTHTHLHAHTHTHTPTRTHFDKSGTGEQYSSAIYHMNQYQSEYSLIVSYLYQGQNNHTTIP